MFMKKKGIRYAVASNGEEAVQKWKEGNFDLVLVRFRFELRKKRFTNDSRLDGYSITSKRWNSSNFGN